MRTSTQIMQNNALYSEKFYIAGTNFTRPPVATVVTFLNSAQKNGVGGSVWILFVHVVQIYSSFIGQKAMRELTK